MLAELLIDCCLWGSGGGGGPGARRAVQRLWAVQIQGLNRKGKKLNPQHPICGHTTPFGNSCVIFISTVGTPWLAQTSLVPMMPVG